MAALEGMMGVTSGMTILPIGGATNAGHYLRPLGPQGFDLRLAGLCDVGEEGAFRRGLEPGFGSDLTRADMESMGFFVCIEDLEDELIRSIGVGMAQQVVNKEGELHSFRVFQGQPAQRDRSIEQQLGRFMGTRAGRKARYGNALVASLDLDLRPPTARARARSCLASPETAESSDASLEAGGAPCE